MLLRRRAASNFTSYNLQLAETTMEEDTEVLDWGHEEDEQLTAHFQQRASDGRDSWRDQEDAEDAVSLGGDEDDMQNFYNHRSTEPDASKGQPSTPKMSFSQQQHSHQSKRDYQREPSGNSQKQQPPLQSQNPGSPQLRRSQSHGKMTHALPPKPVVSVAPVHPSPAQTSTLASSMVQRERRVNGHGKPVSSSDGIDVLPPDWEVRYPRSGGSDHYYYNLKTHESTWTQPGLVSGRSSPLKDRESGTIQTVGGRSPNQISHDATVRADSTERHVLPSSDHKDLKHKTSPAGQLSYEDRHYRPGGSSHASASVEPSDRREDRGSSTQSPYPEGSYHPSRVPTPRNMSERRRTRSISPRRDSQTHDRFVRVRREMTPPRSAIDHGTWKEPHRDIPATRQSNVPDHAWSSSRNALPEEPMPGQVHENRPRGRPPRVGVEPSTHSAPKGPKVHASDQWSPTSTLFASSHTSRTRRLCSSRGGGRVSWDCLEKPWESSFAVPSSILSSTLSRARHKDAHHGLLFYPLSPLILTFLYILHFLLQGTDHRLTFASLLRLFDGLRRDLCQVFPNRLLLFQHP